MRKGEILKTRAANNVHPAHSFVSTCQHNEDLLHSARRATLSRTARTLVKTARQSTNSDMLMPISTHTFKQAYVRMCDRVGITRFDFSRYAPRGDDLTRKEIACARSGARDRDTQNINELMTCTTIRRQRVSLRTCSNCFSPSVRRPRGAAFYQYRMIVETLGACLRMITEVLRWDMPRVLGMLIHNWSIKMSSSAGPVASIRAQ